MNKIIRYLPWFIIDSKLYFHLYYKHTKKHKEELERIRSNVLRVKREILGYE